MLALFAPDAVVRERRGEVPPAVWDTRDSRVVVKYLEDSHYGAIYDTGGLVWAMGHRQIAAWAAARFAQHHRYAVGPPRAAGDTVGWPYREYADPFQFVRGFSPTEGDAEAVVRGGRIAVLSLVQTPESAQRRWREVGAVLERPVANRHAAPLGDGPRSALSGALRGSPATEPTDAAWPLALGGLALLAAGTAALRRRRLPVRRRPAAGGGPAVRERHDAPVPGVDTGSTVAARFETVRTLDDCREAVKSLRRAVDGPLVRAGMDAERVRRLAQHLDGAFGVLDAAVQATPAYQAATLLDGAPRVGPGRSRWPTGVT